MTIVDLGRLISGFPEALSRRGQNARCQKSPAILGIAGLLKGGTLEGIRTPDLLIRSQALYPAELRVHSQHCCGREWNHGLTRPVKKFTREFFTVGCRGGTPGRKCKACSPPRTG